MGVTQEKKGSINSYYCWVLLANDEKGLRGTIQNLPRLSSPRRCNPYLPKCVVGYDNTMVFPHLGTWSHRAYKPPIQWLYMDLSNHRVLYKMGRGQPFEKSHWSSRSKLHSRTYNYTVGDPQEIDQRQQDPIHKQRHEGVDWGILHQAWKVYPILPTRKWLGEGH